MTVEGYCGLFGSGKTYAMVMEVYNVRRRQPEMPIMTNLGRLDLPGVPVEYLSADVDLETMLAQLGAFRSGYLLLDEVGVYLPARVWSRMPVELSWKWQQLRKDGIELRWSCIRPNNVVKDLRDITFETHWCTSARRLGFFSVAHYSYTAVGDKKYFQSRSLMRFRPGLAGKLYDTMGKVKAAPFVTGRPVVKGVAVSGSVSEDVAVAVGPGSSSGLPTL